MATELNEAVSTSGPTPQAVPSNTRQPKNAVPKKPEPTTNNDLPTNTVADTTADPSLPKYGDPTTIVGIGGQPNVFKPYAVVNAGPAEPVAEQAAKDKEYFDNLFKVDRASVVDPKSEAFNELVSGASKKVTDLGEVNIDSNAKLTVGDFDTLAALEEQDEYVINKVWDEAKGLYVDKKEKSGKKIKVSPHGLKPEDHHARDIESSIFTKELKPLFTKNLVVIFGASGYTTNNIYKALRPGSTLILPAQIIKLLLLDEAVLYTFDTDGRARKLVIDYTTNKEGDITTEEILTKKIEEAKTPEAKEKEALLAVITKDLDKAKEEFAEDKLPKDIEKRRDTFTVMRKKINAIQHLIWNFIYKYGDEKLNKELTPVIDKYDKTVEALYDLIGVPKTK